MRYLIGNKEYSFSYTELKECYYEFVNYTDEEFLNNLVKIIHFCCIVCYIKEIPNEASLSDEGIIHQLVHLLDKTKGPSVNIQNIRNQFKEIMIL